MTHTHDAQDRRNVRDTKLTKDTYIYFEAEQEVKVLFASLGGQNTCITAIAPPPYCQTDTQGIYISP